MRFKIDDLRFMMFIIFILYLNLNSYLIIPVYAVDSTPSADIRTKLEDLKKEIASKAAALKQQINKKLKDKAYVGKIKTKSQTALTIATKNGPKIVNVNQDSEFDSQLKDKKIPTLKSLREEDYLAALGDVDETGVLTAKKVILLPNPAAEVKIYLWGQVIAISDKLLTVKDRNLKTTAVSYSDYSKVNTGDFVILTGSFGKNNIFDAQFVYIIPQGGVLKPKKIATPSGQIATPSAKPTTKSATSSGIKK